MALPGEAASVAGTLPSALPEEALRYVGNAGGVFLNLQVLKRFNQQNRRCLCLYRWHVLRASYPVPPLPARWGPGPLALLPRAGRDDAPSSPALEGRSPGDWVAVLSAQASTRPTLHPSPQLPPASSLLGKPHTLK